MAGNVHNKSNMSETGLTKKVINMKSFLFQLISYQYMLYVHVMVGEEAINKFFKCVFLFLTDSLYTKVIMQIIRNAVQIIIQNSVIYSNLITIYLKATY